MSGINLSIKEDKKSSLHSSQNLEKIKQVDALYRHKIREIYAESKSKIEKQQTQVSKVSNNSQRRKDLYKVTMLSPTVHTMNQKLQNSKSVSSINYFDSSASSKRETNPAENDDKSKSTIFYRGQSMKNVDGLKKQNELKEIKIRELGQRCEQLVEKLKNFLPPEEIQKELDKLKNTSATKVQQLERLFKIKSQEIFFKLKIQVSTLLQQFGIQKDQLAQMDELSNQTSLFNYLSRKLKWYLKECKSKQQQCCFEMQRDKILNQKQQERIHFLSETNELLKLQEVKLKNKIEDLKNQLQEYIDKIKENQQLLDDNDNIIFRLKKENEQLVNSINKLAVQIKTVKNHLAEQQKIWEIREKEMKGLLNNYVLQKNNMEEIIEEKEGEIQEIMIRQKYLQNQNEKLSKEMIKYKERYQWLERQNINSQKDLSSEIQIISNQFEQYKNQYNKTNMMQQKAQIDELLLRIESYQRAYEAALLQYEENRTMWTQMYQETDQRLKNQEKEWKQRFQNYEKNKEEEIAEITREFTFKLESVQGQNRQKEDLLLEEMEARMRTLIAERDKKATEKMIQVQHENQELRKELANVKDYLKAKENFINALKLKAEEHEKK